MRKLFLFLFILSTYITNAQHNIVESPKFHNYFTKTVDTLNYYKNRGTLKGNVREVTKYVKSYRATSKYFNLKKKPVTVFGKKLYRIISKNDSIKETILNYKNKQEGNVTVKTNYRQIPSLSFEIIRITTSAELNDKMDVLTEIFEIKRDKKQNIIEVKNSTNQNWSEKITFRYKYY